MGAKIPIEAGCQGRAHSPSEDGRPSTPCGAPSPAVETLDGPFQSEKGLFQEIAGELRRLSRPPGDAAAAGMACLRSAVAMKDS
jgi:hypothetical protein